MVEIARIKFNESKCTAIRTNAQIIYDAFESGLGCNCQHAHKSNVELNWHRDTQSTPTTFSFAFSFAAVDQTNAPDRHEIWKQISAQLEKIAHIPPPVVQQPVQDPVVPSSSHASESVRKRVVKFFEERSSMKPAPRIPGNEDTPQNTE